MYYPSSEDGLRGTIGPEQEPVEWIDSHHYPFGAWVSDRAWKAMGPGDLYRDNLAERVLAEVDDLDWSAVGMVLQPDGTPVGADAETRDYFHPRGADVHMHTAVRRACLAHDVSEALQNASFEDARAEGAQRERFTVVDGCFLYDMGAPNVYSAVLEIESSLEQSPVLDEEQLEDATKDMLVQAAAEELESVCNDSVDTEELAAEFVEDRPGLTCAECDELSTLLNRFIAEHAGLRECQECGSVENTEDTTELQGVTVCQDCGESTSQVDVRELVTFGDLVIRDERGRIVHWNPVEQQWIECPWRWREVLNK